MLKPEWIFYRGKDWWRSKVAFIAGYVYLLIYIASISFAPAVSLILLILITSVGFALTGYIINDYFDQATDAKAGKSNLFLELDISRKVLIFSGSLMLAIVPWFFLPLNFTSVALLTFEGILFVAYSAPVIRLKERNALGLISDALYAHIIPSVLLANTVLLVSSKKLEVAFFLIIIVWQFFAGIRNIIIHQLHDFNADKISGVRSWVTTNKNITFGKIIIPLIFFEVVSFVFLMAYVITIHKIAILAPALLLAYSLLTYCVPKRELNAGELFELKHFPNYLYEKVLPVTILFLLAIIDLRYSALFIIHVTLFNFVELTTIFNKTRFYSIKAYYTLKKKIVVPFWVMIKTTANYAIYYLLRIFSVDLIKENSTALNYFKKKLFRPKN